MDINNDVFRSYTHKPKTDRDRIWFAYKIFKQQAYIIRSGFGTCGIYPIDFETTIPRVGQPARPESDLEHVAGLTMLIRAISWYYPNIIPKEQLDDFLFGAQIHEIGELKTGDIPDDGSRDEKSKVFTETLAVKKYLFETAPPEEYKHAMRLFIEMNDKSTEFGKTLYFIDKLEAVLQSLFFESMGHPGLLSFKQEHFGGISELDKKHIEDSGSDTIAEAWTRSLIDKGEEYEFKHLGSFISIVDAAARDVRGGSFSWITK